jgi:hypothetical protein
MIHKTLPQEVMAFSPDYSTARARFRQQTTQLGWRLESLPLDVVGPQGEALTIDVGISPGDSSKVLVVSSGVHGVEGFFGSAVQLAWLREWATQRQDSAGQDSSVRSEQVKCVLLHGQNPFGFAHLRRFNENNVDPNRNFLLPGEEFAGSPAEYAALDSLLNPPRPPSRWEPFTLKALLAVARYGMPALRQAIAGGQYDFPRGLFFGGKGRSQMQQLLAEHLPRWLAGSRQVMHLDFHTGLGAWGTYKLLIDSPLDDSQRVRLAAWFGADSCEVSDSSGIAYEARGGFGHWCVASNFAPDYLFACAEFGTYGPITVLAGLRAENQTHHWGQPTDPATSRAKQRLCELFCPANETWRTSVLEQSLALIRQAVEGLGSIRSP